MKKSVIALTLISTSLLTFNAAAKPHNDHGQMEAKDSTAMVMMKECMKEGMKEGHEGMKHSKPDRDTMDHSKMDSADMAVMKKCMKDSNKEMNHDAKKHSESKQGSAHNH